MVRKIPNQFRISYNGINMSDSLGTSITFTSGQAWASRTSGAVQIDQLALQPPTLSSWKILGVSVSAQLALGLGMFYAGGQAGPIGGRLPKIRTGISPGAYQTSFSTSNTTQTYVPGVFQLPGDSSCIGTLFDPASDDLPPVNPILGTGVVVTPATLAVTVSVNPPQPIAVTAGMTLGIGMWMDQGILQMVPIDTGTISSPLLNCGLFVLGASYNVIYDDGA